MRDDYIRRVRTGIEAFARGDLDAALAGFADEVVWEVCSDLAPDAAIYRGLEGIREFWTAWRQAFEDFQLEIVECEALDDRRVLVATTAHGVGAGSGIAMGSQPFFQLFELDGDVVVRVRLAASRETLLAAGSGSA